VTDDAAVSLTQEMLEKAERIRTEMGGVNRIDALHRAGRLTAREHIDLLLDEGSFREIGTFARSIRPEDHDSTPADGKVVGRGTVEGRTVAVAADDGTVKRASTSHVNAVKVGRVFASAKRDGVPLVAYGETGGARIPDIMGSEGFAAMPQRVYAAQRKRLFPLVSVITGESFGGSSFMAASSDLTVQLPGTCLAITSPRVIELAMGEKISMDELGGPKVNARVSGQIDRVAADGAEAAAIVRQFLSYLPPNSWTPPPRAKPVDAPDDVAIDDIVPSNRRRAWDMRKLVRGLCDRDSPFEMMPEYGRSIVTTLARIDGRPVGVIGSQPMVEAGVIGPDACDKAARFICLCDAFGLPLVFLHDTPGFMVGSNVEHDGLLHKAMMFWQAVALAGVPKFAVVVRKSYGVADFAMSGIGMESELLYAWPQAEIGFMDPETAANVLRPGAEEVEARHEMAEEIARDIAPYGAAGIMRVDEIIAPGSTRQVLVDALDDVSGRPFQPGSERPLASWPVSW
jgi:methylmalonyl-CoA decarboxylase subunit alpha